MTAEHSPTQMRKESHTTKFIPGHVIDAILVKLPLKSVFRFKCVSRPWHDLICDSSIARFRLQLAEFLLKLPPKALVRFKCVCSSWNDLISHPSFARAHLQHNRHNTSIVSLKFNESMAIWDKNTTCDELVLKEFIPMPRFVFCRTMLICSCDGILCYTLKEETTSENELVLWNPSIRKHKILKVPKRKSPEIDTFAIGYDLSIDDYKLIRISESMNRRKKRTDNIIVEVMAMKSNQWRRVSYNLPYNCNSLFYGSGLVVSQHGALYWFKRIDKIIRFDLATETFNQVSSPPNCKSFLYDFTSLVEVDGKMYLTTYSNTRNITSIWIMKDGTWERFFCCSLNIDADDKTSQLIFVEGGAFLQTRDRTVYIHGMKDEANREAQPLENSDLYYGFECVHSLVSP